MADKVHPPNVNATGAASTNKITSPTAPPTKPLLPQSRPPPVYRYRPPKHRHRRGCCCRCCCCTTVLLIILIILAAIAAAILYFLYRPQSPTFHVNSLRLSTFNITTSSHLTSNLNLTLTARNPNKEVKFSYQDISVSVVSLSNEVEIGQSTWKGFVHGKKNATVLRSSMGVRSVEVGDAHASELRREIARKDGLALKVVLDTKVKATLGSLKSPRVGIRVTCDGIKVGAPTRKTVAIAETSQAKCKVDLRIKIWRWTF